MGDLWDCIEKAKRQGEDFSTYTERQHMEQEVKLGRLESRIDDLQEQIAGLKQRINVLVGRETIPDAASRRAHPQYSFTEWLLRYGHQDESSDYGVWVIEEADVEDWLKRCGLEDYI